MSPKPWNPTLTPRCPQHVRTVDLGSRFLKPLIPNPKTLTPRCPQHLRTVDMSCAPLYTHALTWGALLQSLPAAAPKVRLIVREPSAWAHGAIGLLGAWEGFRVLQYIFRVNRFFL